MTDDAYEGVSYELRYGAAEEHILVRLSGDSLGNLASMGVSVKKERNPGNSNLPKYITLYIRGEHWPDDQRVEVLEGDEPNAVRDRVLEREARLRGH